MVPLRSGEVRESRGVLRSQESYGKSGKTERVRESQGILKVPECKKVL